MEFVGAKCSLCPVETSVATYPREALLEDRLSDLLIDRAFELYGPLVNNPVLLFYFEKDKTQNGKLESNWTGPFYIQSVLGKGVYCLVR